MPVDQGLTMTGLLALHRLVAFDALLGVVARLAFLDDELDAADAAVALVQHLEIVVHAVRDRDARARERSGPIGEERHVDLVLGGSRGRGDLRHKGQCPPRARSISFAA